MSQSSGQAGAERELDDAAVEHRQDARHAEADRAGVACWAAPPKAVEQPQKILDCGEQLGVHLEADDGLASGDVARLRPTSRHRRAGRCQSGRCS